MARTVEELLRYAEDRAALMRFLVELAADSPATSDPKMLVGFGDVFEDIENGIRRARQALSVEALNVEVLTRD